MPQYKVTFKSGTEMYVFSQNAEDARRDAMALLRKRLGGDRAHAITPGNSPHHQISSVQKTS